MKEWTMTEQKRIGEYLIENNKISPQELEQALYIQSRRAQVGAKPLLGTVLLEMWRISEQDLDHALEQQAREHVLVQ
jgi:hypothetical protein